MGNRAVISTREDYDNNSLGLYLHWNGGRDSVEAFLRYCDLRGDRSPETDGYGYARLAQVIGNFLGGTLSLGLINRPANYAEWADNGAYIVENWQIVGREFYDWEEQNEYDLLDMMLTINERQPEHCRIDEEVITACVMEQKFPLSYEEKLEMLDVGDDVWVRNSYGEWEKFEVLGIGETGRIVNGQDISGCPIIEFDKYYKFINHDGETDDEKLERLRDNVNSYLTKDTSFYLPGNKERAKEIIGELELFD